MTNTQNEPVELLPCPDPKCQAGDVQIRSGAAGCHWVRCRACGLSTDDGSKERMAEKWNRLPRLSASSAAVDALRLVEAAMLRHRNGEIGEYGWNITELNKARPAIQAALANTPKQSAGETLKSIIQWGDETFGYCSQERAISRAKEEWEEMEEPDANVPIEAADVIICLLRIPGILDAINAKMAINRERAWNLQGDGTAYHVRSALEGDRP